MDSKSVSPPLPTRDDSETLEPASEAARLANSSDSLVQEPGDLSARRTSALPLTQENPQLPSLPQTLPVHRRPATPSSQRQTYASPQDSSAIPNEGDDENPGTTSPADGYDENLTFSSDPGDVDNIYGDSGSTTSLTESIFEYRWINGRRFHAERGQARYWAPNDEKQLDSEILQHFVMGLVMERNGWVRHHNNAYVHSAAPVDGCQKVLDIGTGTGAWAIDFADTYPEAHVVGTDLSPIQPDWVPPNVEFQVDDFGDYPWTFQPDSFDFVHSRWNSGSVTSWDAHFKEAYRVLRPGGFLESHEPWPDIEQHEGARETTYLKEWGKLFRAAGEITRKTFDVAATGMQKQSVEKAGFVDVREKTFWVPIGSWAKDEKLKEIGILQLEAFSSNTEGYMGYIATEIMGWSRQEADILAAHIRREVKNPKHYPLFRQTVVWGRKP